MIERIVIVTALLILTVGGAQAVRLLARRRTDAVIGGLAPSRLSSRLSKVSPTVVYFYGPRCEACIQQARALDELAREGTKILAFDATEERDLADALGVLTIPTTALVDVAGRIQKINLGYHPKQALALQLAAL